MRPHDFFPVPDSDIWTECRICGFWKAQSKAFAMNSRSVIILPGDPDLDDCDFILTEKVLKE